MMLGLHKKIHWKNTTSIHEGKKPFQCNICDLAIGTVHGGTKPFQCNFCVASFLNNSNMNSHMESVHEKKKPYKCDICDASFASIQSLKVHTESVHEWTDNMCSFNEFFVYF